jgi:membrane AbrB-like protein
MLILAIACGLAAAAIGARLAIPGATILFPVFVVAGLRLTGAFALPQFPPALQVIVFGFLGTSVGLSIDRAALLGLSKNWPILVGMAVAVYVASLGCVLILAHFGRIDSITALLSGSPGGFVTIAGVGANSGADMTMVLSVQTLRLVLIYLTLPILLLVFGVRR